MIFIIIGNLVPSFLEGRLLCRPQKLLHWGTMGEQLPDATTCVPAFCLVKWSKCWVFLSGISVEDAIKFNQILRLFGGRLGIETSPSRKYLRSCPFKR